MLKHEDLKRIGPADPLLFEPIAGESSELRLRKDRSEIRFHTWLGKECCLPRGATSATLVDPWITVNGCTIVSASKVTEGSIHVVDGSTIVTPASMCATLIRSRSTAAAAASSTRVFTPSVSSGSGAT